MLGYTIWLIGNGQARSTSRPPEQEGVVACRLATLEADLPRVQGDDGDGARRVD